MTAGEEDKIKEKGPIGLDKQLRGVQLVMQHKEHNNYPAVLSNR